MFLRMTLILVALLAANGISAGSDHHVNVTEVHLAYPVVPTIKVQVALPIAQVLPVATVTANYVQAKEFYFAAPLAVYAVEMPVASVAVKAVQVHYCDVAACHQPRIIRRILR